MARQQILVSWIGHTDLNAWADADRGADKLLAEAAIANVLKEEHFKRRQADGSGALKTAAEAGRFDAIHLLSRIPELDREFAKWLGVKAKIHKVKRGNPSDYREVYLEADRVLREIGSENDLNILLTPGTPAMAAVWVLLGKTIHPAKLWQTFQGNLSPTELPFDLALFERQVRQRIDLAMLTGMENLPAGFDRIIGSSEAIMDAKRRAAVVARHDVCVLLLGDPGTGKELFAEAIHDASHRSGRFEKLNCAAIPEALLESELFGHKKGSFTGANADFPGRFQLADKGTLFLDEIGECSKSMQATLLRVLQPPKGKPLCYREFRPVGGKEDENADVRIIAATNRNLRQRVAKRKFREDLYFRLTEMKIKLPPLRERQNDIPELAVDSLQEIRRALRLEGGSKAVRLSQDAIRLAQTWNWVGNVRELKSVLRQAAMFTTGEEISRRDLEMAAIELDESPGERSGFMFGGSMTVTEYLDGERERLYQEALVRSRENQTEAAGLLGLTPAAVSKFVRETKRGRRLK